jgi:nucleoside-diphosphate-sugar epimerase
VAITGGAGLIAGILMRHLVRRHWVRSLDVQPFEPIPGVENVRGSIVDEERLREIFSDCHYVLHLATGSPHGWDGLLEVDIVGTRTVFECAAASGVSRVVFASTNHVAGGVELDRARSRGDARTDRVDLIRPDSPYGAAKAFGEAYGRFISETTSTCVSCLRIGSVRSQATPPSEAEVLTAGASNGAFRYWPEALLSPSAQAWRLRRTWLSHDDLVRIVDEELAASDRFRLRWAVSDNPGRFWPLDVCAWNP